MFKEHGVGPVLSLTLFKIFLSKYYPDDLLAFIGSRVKS